MYVCVLVLVLVLNVAVCAPMSLISSPDTQPDVRADLTEIARSNNFFIKYPKFDWNLNLSRVCTDAGNSLWPALLATASGLGWKVEHGPARPLKAGPKSCCFMQKTQAMAL